MTSRDFAYWLQGFFEISGSLQTVVHPDTGAPITRPPITMNAEQVAMVQKHLALVFAHEIDPSMGGPDVQDKLNKIHNQNTLLRC